MKRSFALMLILSVIFLVGCNKDCKKNCKCSYGTINFSLGDKNNPNGSYFDTHPELNVANVAMYDESGNYTTINGKSFWGTGLFLPSSINFDYHNSLKDPFGMDKKKNFYLHLDKDVDTIRIEYKVKNECMDIEYMRMFYNNKLVLNENSPNMPIFATNIIYK